MNKSSDAFNLEKHAEATGLTIYTHEFDVEAGFLLDKEWVPFSIASLIRRCLTLPFGPQSIFLKASSHCSSSLLDVFRSLPCESSKDWTRLDGCSKITFLLSANY